MPRSAASDLGLHCLHMSFYGTLGINELIEFIITKNLVHSKIKKNIIIYIKVTAVEQYTFEDKYLCI